MSDPLLKNGPEQQKDLFDKMAQSASGRPTSVVLGASVNMIVNAIRQTYPTRATAEADLNEIFGKAKSLLLEHYDSVTGRRRSVFPFTQIINMPLLVDKDGMRH